MTQHAVIKGFARWYGKHILPALAPVSLQKVSQLALVVAAEKFPDITLFTVGNTLGPSVGGMLTQILALASADEAFDALAAGMQEALTKEHIKFTVPDAQGPHGFELDGEEFAVLLAEIKAAGIECARPQTAPPHPAAAPNMSGSAR